MKTIKVAPSQLKETLVKNRDIHEKEYKEALVDYRKKAEELLENVLEKIRNGEEFNFNKIIDLPKPFNALQQYDLAIEMCDWSLTDIELTQQEFNQYVLDRWGWTDSFTQIKAAYTR